MLFNFPKSSKHEYPLRIEPYRLFSGVPTLMSLAEAKLVIHFLAILSRMSLAEANLVIHFPTILLWTSLAKTNLVNMPYFIYIEHNIIVIAFIRKTLNCISVKGRGNHALAPPVSWPPPTEDTILVASPESQRSLWSWFLQAKCYRQSIFIHYTYNSYYACSFPHHNIHTHIKYIFICFYRFRDFDHYSSFLWCDNLGDIYLIMNLVFHACMEDVEIDLTLSNMITHKELQVQFIVSDDQIPICSPNLLCLHVLHSFVVKGCLEQQKSGTSCFQHAFYMEND